MVAGPDFFGYGAASDKFPGFEHQDAAAGFCQIGRGYQAVVTRADDDDVEGFRHARL